MPPFPFFSASLEKKKLSVSLPSFFPNVQEQPHRGNAVKPAGFARERFLFFSERTTGEASLVFPPLFLLGMPRTPKPMLLGSMACLQNDRSPPFFFWWRISNTAPFPPPPPTQSDRSKSKRKRIFPLSPTCTHARRPFLRVRAEIKNSLPLFLPPSLVETARRGKDKSSVDFKDEFDFVALFPRKENP